MDESTNHTTSDNNSSSSSSSSSSPYLTQNNEKNSGEGFGAEISSSSPAHKMKIDELTAEDDGNSMMDVDPPVTATTSTVNNTNSKPIASASKVSSISSVINDGPTSQSSEINNVATTPSAAATGVNNNSSSNVSSTGSVSSSTQSMQLNDAFAYLDRVRAEFADQPEIYNKFLQVMREFKSNSIDANGVIVRVVQLFKGHRNLILGFNAFLPKTHHIDPNIQDFSRWAQNLPGASSMSDPYGPGPYASARPPSIAATTSAAYPIVQPSPYSTNATPMVAPMVPPHHAAAGAPSSANLPQSIPAMGPSANVVRGANTQFNRAVSFVEKIKTRFANQPETYRAFLSLLHSFHRDQRGIKEVYLQVQQLFRNEPDLLEEFSLFLPDNSSSAGGVSAAPGGPRSAIPNSMLPPVGRFPSASSAQGQSASTAIASGATLTGAPYVGPGRPSSKRSANNNLVSSNGTSADKPKRTRAHEMYGVSKTADESEFFDKVKKYLGSRQVYADFLKCLSLFSQDILKLPDLINMVHGFIGGNEELFSWFKRYINFKDSDLKGVYSTSITSGHGRSGQQSSAASFAEAQVPELNLAALKRVGCYRIYPRGYRLCKASGRTVLCDEVLNDEMVSCAVFESEDSGFLSSKKNQYEDALFKCEDERFEMDLILEYNLSTIAVLEPIAKRIEKMTPEEREAFRLDHKLNGTSEIIYKKAIKRIYGDKADDIYEYLQKSPSAAVPVVLKRLKAKDEEWRRVQRDWNRIWAEIHIKNYYKALDHQGIDFKVTDRKTLTARSLVNEIQVIKEEKKRTLERCSKLQQLQQQQQSSSTSTTANAHLSQVMSDSSLLKDLLGLIDVAIRSSASFSGVDRKSLSRFFSTFVPEFFRIETTTATNSNSESGLTEEATEEGDASEDLSAIKASKKKISISSTSQSSQAQAALLLYANDSLFAFVRIFMIAYERLERLKQASIASQNRPFFVEKTNVVAQFLDLHSRQSTMTVDEELAGGRDFYGVLIYLLEQLIEGEIEAGLFEEKVRYMFGTSGYLIFTFDRVLLSLLRQTLAVLNDAACENLIRLYDSWRSRRGPRTSEYSARLAAENILNDNGAFGNVNGSNNNNATNTSSNSNNNSSSSNNNNNNNTNNSNLYRIEMSPHRRHLTILLVDRLSSNGSGAPGGKSNSGTIEEKWSIYVDNFVKLESNPAYLSPKSRPFLNRTRINSNSNVVNSNFINSNNNNNNTQAPLKDVSILYNLECKICINTYKIFYVENTEDLLVKRFRQSQKAASSANYRREKLEEALKTKF